MEPHHHRSGLKFQTISVVIAGLDSAIHRLRKKFLTKRMDPRIKPAGDRNIAWRAYGGARVAHRGRGASVQSKSFDQAGIDQQPVEAPRLRAAGAGVKKALAALENSLLLGER